MRVSRPSAAERRDFRRLRRGPRRVTSWPSSSTKFAMVPWSRDVLRLRVSWLCVSVVVGTLMASCKQGGSDESPAPLNSSSLLDMPPLESHHAKLWPLSVRRAAEASHDVVQDSYCGPAAMYMILKHFGRDTRLIDLERAIGASTGYSALELKRLGESAGLSVRGLKLPVERLREVPMPAIAHVHGEHFVVIRSADSHGLVVDDPALGRLRLDEATFDQYWDGVILVFL